MGVRDENRPKKVTPVADPVRSGHFAISVKSMHASPDWLWDGMVAARQDSGYAGSNRTLTDPQGAITIY
jgi:hypothetical protein